MTEKLGVTANDVSVAALMWVGALSTRLVEKGLLTADEANEIGAMAASMCKGQGTPNGASLIESVLPSSKGIDPIAAAKARGQDVQIVTD